MVTTGGRYEARVLKPADARFCKSHNTVETFGELLWIQAHDCSQCVNHLQMCAKGRQCEKLSRYMPALVARWSLAYGQTCCPRQDATSSSRSVTQQREHQCWYLNFLQNLLRMCRTSIRLAGCVAEQPCLQRSNSPSDGSKCLQYCSLRISSGRVSTVVYCVICKAVFTTSDGCRQHIWEKFGKCSIIAQVLA